MTEEEIIIEPEKIPLVGDLVGAFINPQIYGDNQWYEQTLIMTDSGNGEIMYRNTVGYEWSKPDADIEEETIAQVVAYALDKHGHEQQPQASLRWDWPEGHE